MPNWVFHDLMITGPETERKRFLDECFTETPDGLRFDFDKLIPQPEHIKASTDGGDAANGNVRFPDWYEWNVAHWGDKWNACRTKLSQEGEAIKLSFDTAWNIPWPIFEELVERFPKLTIEGLICEGMYNFGGDIRCQAGEIEFKDKSEEIQAEYERICAEMDARDAVDC